jgi:uncharacterized protein YraI
MRKALVWMCGAFLLMSSAAAQDAVSFPGKAYGTVNVRSGPGAQYAIVAQLAADDEVTVDGRDSDTGSWLRVRLEAGQRGWVPGFALLVDGEITRLPQVDARPTPQGDPDSKIHIVAYGRVNVRGGPGMNYSIVGQVEVGDEADVIGRSNEHNDWLYIRNDNVEGWVAFFTVTLFGDPDRLPLLTLDGSGRSVVSEEDVVKTRFNVRLRAQPDAAAAVLMTVPFDSTVSLMARTDDGEWLYVVYKDVAGWGAARLFDIATERVEALPVFMTEATPEPEATASP